MVFFCMFFMWLSFFLTKIHAECVLVVDLGKEGA